MPLAAPPLSVLILGAGEFGASTALSLIKGPYKGHESLITILDRAANPPAVDAASSDINKIVRQDYSDTLYASLARESLVRWRSPEWSSNFFESGIVAVGDAAGESRHFIEGSLKVNLQPEMQVEGKKVYELKTPEEIKKEFGDIKTGTFEGRVAYKNESGGWANSRGAVVDTISTLRSAGVTILSGEASHLLYSEANGHKDVKGAATKDGRELLGDLVVLAMGSWSATFLPELGAQLLATGQVIGTIQLSEEEAKRYANVPVVLAVDTGFYCFPPNADNIFKFAIHGSGYVNPQNGLPSVPRTSLTPGYETQNIPAPSVEELKASLAKIYPELAEKQWAGSRLCWYSDRKSGDWLLDYHPDYPSLFIASGGSGHAFKFMPVIGDLIVDSIAGRLSPEHQAIFAYNHRVPDRLDGARTTGSKPKLDDTEQAKL